MQTQNGYLIVNILPTDQNNSLQQQLIVESGQNQPDKEVHSIPEERRANQADPIKQIPIQSKPKLLVPNELLRPLLNGNLKLALYKGIHVIYRDVGNGNAHVVYHPTVVFPQEPMDVEENPVSSPNLLNLTGDQLQTIFTYLNLHSLLSLSETCRKMFQATSKEISSKGRLFLIYNEVSSSVTPLKRNYEFCEIIVGKHESRICNSWSDGLLNSFGGTKVLEMNCGFVTWPDLLNMKAFGNLTTLKIENVEFVSHVNDHGQSHEAPDLNRLEILELTNNKNLPLSFFQSCSKLKSLTFGSNENLSIRGIIQQQTCLENLLIYERNNSSELLLAEDFSEEVHFQLKQFSLFKTTILEGSLENLLKFLTKQKKLECFAICFLQEAIKGDFSDLSTAVSEHVSIISKLSEDDDDEELESNDSADAEHQLSMLYFFDNRDNFEWNGGEDAMLVIKLLDNLQKLFPNVENLSLYNASNYKKEYTKTLAVMPAKFKNLKILNFMEFNFVYLLTQCKLPDSCSTVRFKFIAEVFMVDAWKVFIEKNKNITRLQLIFDGSITKATLHQILKSLVLLPELGELEISSADLKNSHLEWVAENLFSVEILMIDESVYEDVPDEIHDLMEENEIYLGSENLGTHFTKFSSLTE